ncbi:CheF family chemotaxis protein [Halosimplex halophilum]|uniref:CheF family chemotaxis protein n=1 Tax=Halosimplex halophilum TaxID=2559572 RepID=UPI00107F6638|nr:CheF family chemotaxis protein [Halosimplex halophilum]
MSDEERPLADTQGRFVQVVKSGRKVNDLEWLGGRILLSNKRLVLASNEGKRQIALAKVSTVKNRKNSNNAMAAVSGYFSVQTGNDVFLVAPADADEFEESLYTALLDGEVALVKHPAVEGGVVRDTEWGKARINVESDHVGLAIASGQFVEIELVDVGTVEARDGAVRGDERRILEIEHTDEEGTSVQTYVSGTTRHVSILESLVRQGELQNATDADLDQTEMEVLMALYSGVSPFEIPEFVGMEVEAVEAVFDRLVEEGILREKRVRRDVRLKARGRNIASDVIGDQ